MDPFEAKTKILEIIDQCEPVLSPHDWFTVPLKPGTFAVSSENKIGVSEGKRIILVREVSKRLAISILLNILGSSTSQNHQLHSA